MCARPRRSSGTSHSFTQTEELFDPSLRHECDSHLSNQTVDSRAAATPRAVNRPTLAAGMYAVLAAFRGRSNNVQVYDVDLPTNSCGTTCVARGLCSGCDGFEPGAFIGFYTGRWGTRKGLGGANAYMLDTGDDEHYVAPPGARSRHVDFGMHAMAAINEPSPGVCPVPRAAPLLPSELTRAPARWCDGCRKWRTRSSSATRGAPARH